MLVVDKNYLTYVLGLYKYLFLTILVELIDWVCLLMSYHFLLQFLCFLHKCGFFCYADCSLIGQFPNCHINQDQISVRHFPKGNCPDQKSPGQLLLRWRLLRPVISPLQHFPDRTFPWPYVLTTVFTRLWRKNRY